MTKRKAFTLIEILIVLCIVGIVAAMTLPNFRFSIEQTNAQMAQSNMLAILAAEQKYSEDNNGSYCINSGANPLCADSTPDINKNLHLSISGPFSYSCSASGWTIPYTCTASDTVDTVTLNPNNVSPTPPVTCLNVSGNAGYCF